MAVAHEVGQSVSPTRARNLFYHADSSEEHNMGNSNNGSCVYPHTRLSWTTPLNGMRVHPPYIKHHAGSMNVCACW